MARNTKERVLSALEEIKLQIQQGVKAEDIASEYGCSFGYLKKILLEAGSPLRAIKPSLTQVVRDNIESWNEQRLTLDQVATVMGTTRESVIALLHRLGLRLKEQSPVRGDGRSEAYASDVIQYVMTKGGSVSAAIDAITGGELRQAIRQAIAARGVDLSDYFFAHRRYGDWLTLPGPVVYKSTNDKLIPCICLLCGKKYDVYYSNLLAGYSTCCKSCATPNYHPVRCQETGTVYPSIRAAVIELGDLNRYQDVRNQIRNQGQAQLERNTLVSVSDS